MTWLVATAPSDRDLDRIMALRPEIAAAFGDVYERLWSTTVDPTLLELCRLRIAQLLRCESELSVRQSAAAARGLDEAKIAELSSYLTSPRFDARERACLAYTERVLADPHGLTDAEVAAVRRHLTESDYVALTAAVAYFEAFARFSLLFAVAAPRGELRHGLRRVAA